MHDFPTIVNEKLNSIISDMDQHSWLFCKNPGHDFTRQEHGKLSFYDTMRLIIGMGKGSTNDEIIEDYNKPHLAEYKGYNHMHLNGFVDVISKAFIDVVIQPGQKPDERKAFHSMLDHFNPDDPEKYIVTADRGYESYDLLFHCELKNLNYVFRVKAPSSSRSMLSTFIDELPDNEEEFDVTIKRFYTDRATMIMKDQQHVYHYINPYKNMNHFYELLEKEKKHLYFMQFRIIKIKTAECSYEYIITNLPHSFSIDDIKECYHWRWGIEVIFRFLKHANGLLYFHSQKSEFLKQEIYANLILYNFGIFIANEAADQNQKRIRKPDNKYVYQLDFSSALKIARKFFIRRISNKCIDIIKLMFKYCPSDKASIPPIRQASSWN